MNDCVIVQKNAEARGGGVNLRGRLPLPLNRIYWHDRRARRFLNATPIVFI